MRTRETERQTVTHRHTLIQPAGGKKKGEEEAERQWDEESCFTLYGRENFVSLSLSDSPENRVAEGGEGRGKMCQTETQGSEKEGKKLIKKISGCR